MSVMRLSAKMDRTDSGTPWGFRMTGGKDFGAPLVIQRINPGSLAAKCGLQVGDTIVRIGTSPTEGLRHKDAQQRILEAGNSLELALERGSIGPVTHVDNLQQTFSMPGDGYGNGVGTSASHSTSLNLGSPQSDFLQSLSSSGSKPAIGIKPFFLTAAKSHEFCGKPVKFGTSAHQTDGGDDVININVERKTIVIPSTINQQSSTKYSMESDVCKTYHHSETLKLLPEKGSSLDLHLSQMTEAKLTTHQPHAFQDEVLDVTTERKKIIISSNKSKISPSSIDHRPAAAVVPVLPTSRQGAWQPQIPTGPRTMRVAKAGEARSLPAVVGGTRIPMCNGCGVAIRGPFVSALDKTWCPDHFVCANPNCRVPLVNCGFVEEAGQLFCEHDYEQYFAPHCGKCGRAIIGEVVNALKNTFHMGCFLCCHCHQPIGTGSFHNEDGKIYCPKDWAAMFQTKCYGCQFPIEPGDRWVEALNQNWHSECFNCATCQVNLEGQSFFAKAGKPYCKKHSAGGRF